MYLAGATFSTDFPTASLIQPLAGSFDVFASKFSAAGDRLLYSTYLGGVSLDQGLDVAVDAIGNARFAGTTLSSDFPLKDPIQEVAGGNGDGFLAVLTDGASPPGLPTGLVVMASCHDRIALAWVDNADNEAAFEIERRQGAGLFLPAGAVEADQTGFTDLNVVPATLYTYRVRAVNLDGASNWSNEASTLSAAGPPAAPTGVAVAVVSKSSLRVTWTDPGPGESGFRVERSADGGATFVVAGTVGANQTEFVDTGLTPNTTYRYRVRILAGGCLSEPSAGADGTTPPDPPAAPTGLTLRVLTDSQIQLTWTDNAGNETGYRVERRTGAGAFGTVAALGPDTEEYTDSGLAPATPYAYRVFAVNGDGDSAPSEERQATTFPLPLGRLAVPKSLKFRRVPVGSFKTLDLRIRNASRIDRLAVVVGDPAAPFSVVSGGGEGQLLIGGQRIVRVRFSPTKPGNFRGQILITSSDPRRPRARVTLTGQGR